MRCVIPQIRWNSCQQILSVDFDPSCNGKDGFYRIVTVGADTNLLIWHLSGENTISPTVKCVAELNRHQKAVNVVRFSPDGNWIASGDDDAYIIIWRNERKSDDEEVWSVDKSLRKHVGDVTDLSWSQDSNFLVSSSVDSSAVLWDVKKGTAKYLWSEHTGYVHGVTYDPNGEVAASISIDRTLRLFDIASGKLKTKVNKYQSWSEETEEVMECDPPASLDVHAPPVNGITEAEAAKKRAPPSGNHIFHDDGLATFCRRLVFSPRGEYLMVPAGICPSTNDKQSENPATSSPADPAKKSHKQKAQAKVTENNNAVVLFCRNDFSVPCAIIPTGSSYSLACRFCPLYFKRASKSPEYGDDMLNPVKKDERRIYCTGLLQKGDEEGEDVLLDCPFRMVYAIATNNTVIIGATDKATPLAIVRNIHFARLTDLAWSHDGKVLVVSSTDGYCSIITFEENELGEILRDPPPLLPSDYPVPVREVKVKVPKIKINPTKKERTPGSKKKVQEGKAKSPGGTPTAATPEIGKPPVPKKVRKIKPTKLQMDPPEEKGTPVPVAVQNFINATSNQNEMPNPFVQLARLHERDFPRPLEITEENEDDIEKSPAPVKLIPQKNTLDRWVIKKAQDTEAPVSGKSEISTPKRELSKRKPEVLLQSDSPNKIMAADVLIDGADEDEIVILSESKTTVNTEKTSQASAKQKPRRVQLITLSNSLKAPE